MGYQNKCEICGTTFGVIDGLCGRCRRNEDDVQERIEYDDDNDCDDCDGCYHDRIEYGDDIE